MMSVTFADPWLEGPMEKEAVTQMEELNRSLSGQSTISCRNSPCPAPAEANTRPAISRELPPLPQLEIWSPSACRTAGLHRSGSHAASAWRRWTSAGGTSGHRSPMPT